MLYRAIRQTDISDVLQMMKELALHERRPEAVTAQEDSLCALLFSESAVGFGLVAEGENFKLQGYALMALKFSSFQAKRILYIDDLYIRPSVRGQGIGYAFMCEIAKFALEKKCHAMEWSALDFNDQALMFYEKIRADKETGRVHFDGDINFITRLAESA